MDIAIHSELCAEPSEKRLNLFERFLTVWVGICMVTGILLGQWVPETMQGSEVSNLAKGVMSMSLSPF